MKKPLLHLALLALLAPLGLRAVTLSTGTDPQGNACDTVAWTDASGQARQVWIKNTNPGAFITRYTWVNNGTPVDARLRENYPPWGFLVLVNHWHPESTGNYVTSCDAANLTVPLSTSVPFAGPHHLVWRGTFRMKMDPAAATSWYNTVQYVFTDGRDDFLFSTAYDSSDMPQSGLWSDMRSPYGEIDWDGDGSSNESISGIGWGTTYKFKSTEPLGANLSSNSPWDNTQPNTIPYIWQWKDSTKQNAELAIVQNERYIDQAAGSETHVGSCTGFTAPPSTGTKMSDIEGTYKACVAYQLNVYANWTGQRFTWGSVFRNVWGMFGNGLPQFAEGHNDAMGLYTYNNQYPVNAWSWNVHVGRWSDGGQAALVTDTENIFATTLAASVGSVVTSGPRGPGNYVAPSTGTMPTKAYAKAGFDPVFRAWRAVAASGAATLNFTVSGSLKRPTVILQSMTALPCLVTLDGTPLVSGTGFEASYDAAKSEVYLTLKSTLAAGARTLAVQTTCGTPTFTPTITRTQTPGGPSNTPTATATRTASPSPTATRTPSFTPVPACSALLVDNVEDGNATNALGGAWSTYAAAPSTVSAPSYAGAGYPSSIYGPLHAVAMSGNNSGTQVGSVSTSFASTDLGTKDRLVFWVKATGPSTSWHVNVARAAIVDYDHYGANFTVPAGVWTRVEILLSSMAQGGWGAAKPMAWNDVNGLTWYTAAVGSYSLEIDDVSFDCPGAPPTATNTRTASPTRTTSPTATATPTSPPVGSSPTQTPSSLLTPCSGNSFGSFLQAGDKILFLGDSITYRGNFTKMVQSHLTSRYPSAGFTFVNQGGPGDAGLQVWNRRAAVVAANPDVVLLCLGMNDAYSIANYQTDYPNYMTQIITYLQGNGIRVALLTPGITDLSLPFISLDAGYNTRLRWEADWVLTYAAAHSIPVYDINAEMAAADAALKAGVPGACMIPDGVHPDPAGGWIMGLGALKALGVPDRCGEVLFNGSTGYVEASGPMLATGAGFTGFDLQLNTLPPVAPAAARKVLPYEPLQAQLNHLLLRAQNLPAASYYIVIDGHRAGPVSSSALAAGVNLYDYFIAPGVSASEWHHIDFVDASGQPATVCDPSANDGLIDDFETPPLGQWLVNKWAGDSWGLDVGTGTSTVSQNPASLVYSSPGYGGTGSCLRLSGTADMGPGNPPVWVCYLNGLNSDLKQGIRFWIKGSAGKSARVQIHTWFEKRQSPEYWNDYGYTFTTSGAWEQISVPFSSMTAPAWGTAYTFNPAETYNIDFLPYQAGAYDISLDNIEFYCTTLTTPTPSRTISPTPSVSPTKTGTSSPTPTATASPTRTATGTASPSRTPSSSPSATASPSVTSTPTETTYAGTPTSTFTFSNTSTETQTFTISPTSSDTATPSPSSTQSPTLTATPSATPTASPTLSSTQSATLTISSTSTSSATRTPSPTLTLTFTASPTKTITQTPVPASPTYTHTLTFTVTLTLTPTPTLTYTLTPPPTLSFTPSPYASATSTPTPTPAPGFGTLEVLEVVPLPNPNPAAFQVKLNGPADHCKVKIYTTAMTRLADLDDSAGSPGGWMQVDARALGLANGTYYYEVWAERGAIRSLKPVIGKLVVLR